MTSLSSLNPQLEQAARYMEAMVRQAGGRLTFTSTRRSHDDQARLYQARGSNPYPVARPGTSKHELGLAFDAVVSPASWQSALGQWWQSIGGRWGGTFSRYDPVHFEA